MSMKTIKVIIIVLLLAILIVGAYVLYNKLAPMMNNQLMGQTSAPAAGENAEGAETTEPAPTPMPDFTVYDLEGNAHKLSDFQGKPVILNFWATWCGYCKMEMPDFQKKFEQYGEEINFLMVNITDGVQETVEKASGYVEEEGFTFPVYYDVDMDAGNTYRINSLPITFFVDAEGNHVAYRMGAMNEELLQAGIDLLLEEK